MILLFAVKTVLCTTEAGGKMQQYQMPDERETAIEIGANLRKIRVQNNLSQEKFAEILGVSRQTVVNWECGKSLPTADKIQKITKEFSVTFDMLCGSDKEEDLHEDETPQECAQDTAVCADTEADVVNMKKTPKNTRKVIILSVALTCITVLALVITWTTLSALMTTMGSNAMAIGYVIYIEQSDKIIMSSVSAFLIILCIVLFAITRVFSKRKKS